MNPAKTWLVTGASSGLGAALVRAAAARGDRVYATGRDRSALTDLQRRHPENIEVGTLDLLDVHDAQAAVKRAVAAVGGIDVLANYAGYGLLGSVEEVTDEQLSEQFAVNLRAPLALTRAVLPQMRARRSGVIVQMSSLVGVVPGPGGSAYVGSKAALDAMSESLAAEVAQFGIRVLIVEPGAFRTGFTGPSLRVAAPHDAYRPLLEPAVTAFKASHGRQHGDPDAAARVVLAAVDADDAPLRLPLGEDAFAGIRSYFERRLENLATARPWAGQTGFRAPAGR
jgi:NAD(P)-dependent dehydrogenase (short-subunit alcohol dehydrogenase family)